MEYQLGIKENALDSFNEALAKFELGQGGEIRQFKFSILHLSHFLELVLKLYITSVDENILFSKCFRQIEARSKRDSIDLLKAYQSLCEEGYDFQALLNDIPSPHTITLDQALSFSRCEKCSITGVEFVDIDFCKDITWIKGLRNNIEHYQFRLSPKEARLCIGRLVRSVAEFIDIFALFDLKTEIGENNYEIFSILADEYTHLLSEAEKEVQEKEVEVFRGVRHKYYSLIEWNVYECPECSNNTMIPSETSSTGYKCTFCRNEESDEIEVSCDCCGTRAIIEDMATWEMDDGSIENRCYFCTAQYHSDKND